MVPKMSEIAVLIIMVMVLVGISSYLFFRGPREQTVLELSRVKHALFEAESELALRNNHFELIAEHNELIAKYEEMHLEYSQLKRAHHWLDEKNSELSQKLETTESQFRELKFDYLVLDARYRNSKRD